MPYIHLFIISFFRIYSFLYYILIHIRIIHFIPEYLPIETGRMTAKIIEKTVPEQITTPIGIQRNCR